MVRRILSRLARWTPVDLGLLAVAVVLVVAAAARVAAGARATGLPEPIAAPPAPEVVPVRDALPPTPPDAVLAAVRADPFRPHRSAPPSRYSLRPERQPASGARARGPAVPELRLKGVATTGSGGLAVIGIRPGSSSDRVYRPGDVVEGFRVQRVAGDSVVLVGEDTTLVLEIERPWATTETRR